MENNEFKRLKYLNNSRQGQLREANSAGLCMKVFQHQVIQLVNQPVLKPKKSHKIHTLHLGV